MADSVHLQGAEDVRRAGHAIEAAAEQMQRAASTMEAAAELIARAMDDAAQRIEKAMAGGTA